MRTTSRTVLGVIGLLLSAAWHPAFAGDWPTWRFDSARSGACPEKLSEKLHLRWRRDLAPVTPAWPLEPRMQFDACYEPVVSAKQLFVGSPIDGSVTAYDTETGKRNWRVFTNGPVRFAPVAWQDKLYVASDDGRVHCLAAATGAPVWTFRAAPTERPDLQHLGNGRLISFWPVRGGPVIANDTLYVGSGLWPVLGTFMYALDPESGAVKWCNPRLNHMLGIRTDHNRVSESSLCPQGYLVFAKNRLLVPNGRSMPVGLDPATGKLMYYVQGYRNGHWRVTAQEQFVFVGADAVLDIATGREMGERWHEGHPETPREYSQRTDLFETPFVPYKFMKGCDAWSALAGGVAYGGYHGTFYAHDVSGAYKTVYRKKKGAIELQPAKWEAPPLWRLSSKQSAAKPASRTIIRAGNRIYTHAANVLYALDTPEGKPAIAWQMALPGTPGTMLAADGKLFVVTVEGQMLCLAPTAGEQTHHPRPVAPLPDADDEWAGRVAKMLGTARFTRGYAVVLGVAEGRLTEELLRQSSLRIVAVEADQARADRLRDRLVKSGHYGTRAEVIVGDPFAFELPPYLASLVVSERFDGGEVASRMSAGKLIRILHPYRGVACFEVSPTTAERVPAWGRKVTSDHVRLVIADGLVTLRHRGGLPGAAPWTHECGGPERTYFSKDKLVKPPLGVLWYGDSSEVGFRKRKDYHTGVKPQVVNGVLVAFDEVGKSLRAYDVYTGLKLWSRGAPSFTRFAAVPDGIYVAGGNACEVLEPVTGKLMRRFEYAFAAADTKSVPLFVADIRVGEDTAVIAVDTGKSRNLAKGLYDSKALIGLDRKTGKQLWTAVATDRFNHHALAIGGGHVFCVDSPSARTRGELKRRGKAPGTLNSTVRALDPRTGTVTWEKVFANPFVSYEHSGYPAGSVQSGDDALFYSAEKDVLIVYKDRRYRGVKGATGDLLWEQERGANQPIMVQGEIFYNQGGGAFEVMTGAHIPGKGGVHGGHGCNHAIGNEHLIFRRHFTAAYFDMHKHTATHMLNVRSGCTNSLIPADGVLSAPCFSAGCVCNHPIETSFSLVHMPIIDGWLGDSPAREPLPLGERDPTKLAPEIRQPPPRIPVPRPK